ncbi:hypothetical protein DL769_009142 [Monosporascus sp. CRB-8-3]|nr:hypothetical protein DL769_009142 [Monosporascus sp. CRB-8-3]
MGKGFFEAEPFYLQSYAEMATWIEIDKDKAKGYQLLDCMWVYVYKSDEYGWFLKSGGSFRVLMAIAVRFDLELIQDDVERGKILHPQKALYGLREAPLSWQREFTDTLKKLAFEPIPHEPYCYSRDDVLIFFYVDDIVLAYRKEKQPVADATMAQLKSIYNLTGGYSLQWFLGIDII